MLRIDPLFQTEYYITFPKIICLVLSEKEIQRIRPNIRPTNSSSQQFGDTAEDYRSYFNENATSQENIYSLMETTEHVIDKCKTKSIVSNLNYYGFQPLPTQSTRRHDFLANRSNYPHSLSRSRPLYLKGNLGKWPHLVTHWQNNYVEKKNL